MSNSKEIVARRIAAILKKKGKTAYWLSQQSGVTQSQISRILTGESNPSLDTMAALASSLGVEVWNLVGGSGQPPDMDEAPIPPKPSPSSVTGPLTAEDGALILARLASATPAQRALALTILFEEPEFLKDFELPKELVPSILGAVKVK